ncbi:MAG: hypothetical protein ACTSX4_10100 [Candidatus Helarchaeota archaeon]
MFGSNATCTYTYYEQVDAFNVTQNGYYINETTGQQTQYQLFFWIHIVEGFGSEAANYIGKTYQIIDPIGVLGTENSTYNLIITAYTNYWPRDNQPTIHGAQASIMFIIVDSSTGAQVAEGLMDRTCGLVFDLRISAGSYRTMEISSTNYDISRNRLIGWVWALTFAFAVPVVSYLIFWKVPHYKVEDKEERLEMAALIACGEAAFCVDIFMDVWLYTTIGFVGNLILHAIITSGFAAVCIWRRYGIKWIIPAILEFGFIGGMYFADPVTYVPYLTAFMGLLISFLMMVFASGYKKSESSTKIGKILNEII